jgi:hypothetical protein
MTLAGIIMTLDYPELNLILNCAGTSSVAAEDSVMSKPKKEERRHRAPLPVATAATAQGSRSTANAVISSVLQRAIVPQQEGEEKIDTLQPLPATPLPVTLLLTMRVDPEQPEPASMEQLPRVT